MTEQAKNKIAKYQKILDLNSRQLDLIQLELANKKKELNDLSRVVSQLRFDLAEIQNKQTHHFNLNAYRQIGSQLMISKQQKINEQLAKIDEAKLEVAEIGDRLSQQNIKVKTWEKVIEKEQVKQRDSETKKEMNLADDRYLATMPPRTKC